MGAQSRWQRMPLVELPARYRARAGAALALSALLKQSAVQDPLMDWLLEVDAADGSFWYLEVSRRGYESTYRRADHRTRASQTGYFFGEADCELPGFKGVPQPCLIFQTGEEDTEPRLAIRVWDVIAITRLV